MERGGGREIERKQGKERERGSKGRREGGGRGEEEGRENEREGVGHENKKLFHWCITC